MGPPSQRRLHRRRGAEHPRGLPAAGAPTATQALHRYLEASRYAFADRNAYLARPGVLRRAAARPAVRRLRGRAARADHRHAPPAPSRRATRTTRGTAGGEPASVDRASRPPTSRSPTAGQRRLLHVHDRVHGRQRHRRAGLRVPAQQRADRLQLRLDDAPEPRGGRQAAAQLDGADDRQQARQAGPRRRLTGRLDDHHHRAAGPRSTGSTSARRCRRRSPRRGRSQRNGATTHRRAGVHRLAEGPALAAAPRPRASRRTPHGEIGAVTGIEFLAAGRFLAAAEPVRRGGGSAGVVQAALGSPRARAGARGRRRPRRPRPPAPRSRTGRWRPPPRARSSARAQAMSRGVSPITTVRSRGQAPAPGAGDRRQLARGRRWSEPKPPWPALEVVADAGAGELAAARSARGCRSPARAGTRPAARPAPSSSSGTPGATVAERSGGHSVARRRSTARVDHRRPARVDRRRGPRRPRAAGRARSPRRCARRPRRRSPSSGATPCTARRRLAQRPRVLDRGTLQQRAVDVEQQEER